MRVTFTSYARGLAQNKNMTLYQLHEKNHLSIHSVPIHAKRMYLAYNQNIHQHFTPHDSMCLMWLCFSILHVYFNPLHVWLLYLRISDALSVIINQSYATGASSYSVLFILCKDHTCSPWTLNFTFQTPCTFGEDLYMVKCITTWYRIVKEAPC